LFGGEAKDVTVWGESAGGGSIIHHLTQYGGKRDPLFKRAIIQSPGFGVSTWNRKVANERTYQSFLQHAGCGGKDINCLRGLETKTLKDAEYKAIAEVPEGEFGFGPTADGEFVRQFPQLELASGNYWKGLESVIVTHVTDESSMFVNKESVYNDKRFEEYVDWQYGNHSAIRNALLNKFKLAKYKDARARQVDYVKYSTFTCATRLVAQAYPDRFWAAQYEGGHGSGKSTVLWSSGG
jgi:carboxylesterase type B